MQMYPAYTAESVLNMPMVTFVALLIEGYRLQAKDNLQQASIAGVPYMREDDRKKFIQNLEWASMHPDDILNTDNADENGIEKLRNMFGSI